MNFLPAVDLDLPFSSTVLLRPFPVVAVSPIAVDLTSIESAEQIGAGEKNNPAISIYYGNYQGSGSSHAAIIAAAKVQTLS